MLLFASTLGLGLGLLAVYIRFAPSDPAAWHIALNPRPAPLGAPSRSVVALDGAAYVDIAGDAETLHQLDAIARATPRTQQVAGQAAEGRITWVTRSRLIGFPDYTTAQLGPHGITLYARLRFGRSDSGVNAARLQNWTDLLSQN